MPFYTDKVAKDFVNVAYENMENRDKYPLTASNQPWHNKMLLAQAHDILDEWINDLLDISTENEYNLKILDGATLWAMNEKVIRTIQYRVITPVKFIYDSEADEFTFITVE